MCTFAEEAGRTCQISRYKRAQADARASVRGKKGQKRKKPLFIFFVALNLNIRSQMWVSTDNAWFNLNYPLPEVMPVPEAMWTCFFFFPHN